jgi:hypothetical protein
VLQHHLTLPAECTAGSARPIVALCAAHFTHKHQCRGCQGVDGLLPPHV